MPYHVMQDWTAELPHRQQGVLVLALRGPDGTVKESGAKNIIRSLRGCSMNNGRTGKPMERGDHFDDDRFMSMRYIDDYLSWETETKRFLADIDSFNLHFWQHLIHAAAVCGFNHPDLEVRDRWLAFYHRNCRKLHVHPETKEEFVYRLRGGMRTEEEELA